MTQEQPSRPANIENIVAINQGKRPLTLDLHLPPALLASQFQSQIEQGAAVVDTRSPSEFGAAHIPGALNIQLDSQEFEQRIGWVMAKDHPILLITNDEAQMNVAMNKLAFIGLESNVKGYLQYGMETWLHAGLSYQTLPQISVHHLKENLPANTYQVLDVRENSEWEAGHIAGAAHQSYKTLQSVLQSTQFLEKDTPIAVICAGGYRSSTASSILQRAGYKNIHNVTGGMDAWAAANYPMETSLGLPVMKM